jgi:hypothetical protein
MNLVLPSWKNRFILIYAMGSFAGAEETFMIKNEGTGVYG